MKRSFWAIALVACASSASYCYDAVLAPVASVLRAGVAWLKGVALRAVAMVGGGSARADLNPVSIFASAKAFVLRLAKRERPVLTASWRMCPSA